MRSEHPNVWITQLEPIGGDGPLAGWTLAVKDNIDVAGVPTTAACPAYAYVPDRSAPVVQRLVEAGAAVVGKTNMDQFATGLTGARSPHGPCVSARDPERISGGSSSGSGVAVAGGLARIGLGTDTAGSGRVPAACNDIVGWKPTPGLLPIDGIVPACRSIDCPSVFASTIADARAVLGVLAPSARPSSARGMRFAVPDDRSLDALAPAASAAFERTIAGFDTVPIDLTPFFAVGDLLYGGAWLAERCAAVGDFLDAHPDEVHPVVASIIGRGRSMTAVDAWRDRYRLDELRLACDTAMTGVDALLLPTVPDVPLLADVLADPVGTNVALGRFTTFVNLLGMCAVAVPGAARADGVPAGVSVIARGGDDRWALDAAEIVDAGRVELTVVGAHLRGQPLNHQLTDVGGALVRSTRTAPSYRLYALETTPPKPGLVRAQGDGTGIEVEVWSLPITGFGTFVAAVPPPLAIGSIELADGSWCSGFVCEPAALEGAHDITSFGGWRAYLGSRA